MVQKFSEIDHVTPLFKFFLVIHLQTHSEGLYSISRIPYIQSLEGGGPVDQNE